MSVNKYGMDGLLHRANPLVLATVSSVIENNKLFNVNGEKINNIQGFICLENEINCTLLI